MTSQPGKQIIAIHMLPKIARGKGNQAITFGRLIEYKCDTFFLKNHTQNMVKKLFPDPFLKKQN